MISRRVAVVVIALFGAWLNACAAKKNAVVVLLPEPEDGKVGRANVENKAGVVNLSAGRDATRVKVDSRPGTVTTMSEADVQRLFGDALSALPPPSRRFVLHFRFESDTLTDEARALMPQILRALREMPSTTVVVTGHTDTMGLPQANYQLGLKRATMVRNLLISAGLNAAQIEASSLGETDLLVRTPDETAEPRNRRVDITVR
jgi:outer membrane protein OmpA-like peptidoglycan-associated protein